MYNAKIMINQEEVNLSESQTQTDRESIEKLHIVKMFVSIR